MSTEPPQELLTEPGFSAAVLDTIGALVVAVEPGGRIAYTNRACQTLTGYTAEEIRGQSLDRFLIPEEAEGVREVLRSLNAGQFPNSHENHWVTRSGEARLIAWANTALLDDSGQVRYFIGTGTDVTEQRRSQQALHEVEERFRELTENISALFYIRDLATRTMFYVSPAYETLWERPVQALYDDPQDFLTCVHPDDRDRVRNAFRSQTLEHPYDVEYRIVRADGTLRWIHARTFPVFNEAGEVYRMAGIAEDITERKLAEEALRDSEARLRQIIDLVPHMIFVKDWEGRFLLVNKAKADFFGKTVEDLTGQLHQDYQDRSASSFEQMRADDQEVMASGRPKHIAEERLMDPAGGEHIFETVKVPYAMAGSNWPAVLGVAADITERRRMAQTLAEEAERYRLVVSTLAQGVVMIGADGRFRAGNTAAARIIGVPPDDLVGKHFFPQAGLQRIDENGQVFPLERHPIAVSLRTGQSFSGVVMGLVQEDDTVVWVSINTRPTYRDGDPNPDAVVVSLMDITAQKNAEAALRTSEERLRRSQEFADVGTWDWDLTTDKLYWSERVAPIFGLTPGTVETVRETFWNLVYPDDLERVEAAARGRIEDDGEYEIDYRIVRPDGSVRWVHSRGDVLRDADGVAMRMLGTVQDITERKRSEQALQESEAKYRAVMENASDGIAIADLDATILDANKRMAQMLGYSREELIGMNARYIHPPEEEANLRAAWADITQHGRSLYQHLVVRKDGTTAPVEVAGTLLKFGAQSVMLGIFRDIGERKRAQVEMAKLSRALEETADSILITDVDGRIEYVNRGFEVTTGYSSDQVLGRNPRLLQSGLMRTSFYRRFWQTILGGSVFRAVFINRKADGSIYYEDKTISPLRDDSGKISHFISSARDVTARMRAEQERLSQERMQRTALVREVHHRIKNHLQGLTGLLHQHLNEYPSLAEPLGTVIGRIHSVAVVHGLQGSAGHGEIRLCEMVSVISQSINSLRGVAAGLQVECDGTCTTRIAVDEAVSVALIINELVVNAVKHGSGQDPGRSVRLRLECGVEQATLWVVSQGSTLPAGFDFASGRGVGTGLGLVRALLPHDGAELTISDERDGVQARLTLYAPVIEMIGDGGMV